MTGFGSSSGVVEGVEFAIEIRSVNNRYLKILTKLPEIWSAIETEVEQLVRARVRRGTVTLRVRMRLPEDRAAHRVNVAALQSYVDQLKMLETEADPTMHIDLAAVMQLPGVCEPPPADELCEATHEGLTSLISQAIDRLVEMRDREGETLAQELGGQCDEVSAGVAAVSERAPKVVQDYQKRLADRVAELVNAARVQIDSDTLAREVAIFAERSDITEEVTRLTGHVAQFREAAQKARPAGRKLEFIAQEMLREANTIASKANDPEIAQQVVIMKTAIDRIKEQVANVE
jgi:uncharacterized protein (TIGR00255 family)